MDRIYPSWCQRSALDERCRGNDATTIPVFGLPVVPKAAVVEVVHHPTVTIRADALRQTTLLIDMVRMRQWQLVLDNPGVVSRRQAKYCDAHGLYPLHWAVSGDAPITVVRLLVEIYPSLLKRVDRDHCTPLHLAAQYGSDVVVSYLRDLCPRAAHRLDRYGRSPLWYAVQNQLSLETVMGLAKTAPRLIVTPTILSTRRKSSAIVSSTPLHLVWAKVLADPSRHTGGSTTWHIAIELLLTAYTEFAPAAALPFSTRCDDTPVDCRQAIHAAIYLDMYLPEPALALLVCLCPEQLRLENSLGQLPLSAAVVLDDGGLRYQGQDEDSEWQLLERRERQVHLLLKSYPQGAYHINPRNCRSALMEAIAHGHAWTTTSFKTAEPSVGLGRRSMMQQLFEVASDLIHGRDGEATGGLPPALLAAMTTPLSWESRNLPKNETIQSRVAVLLDVSRRLVSDKHRERMLTLTTADPVESEATAVTGSGHCAETNHLTTIFTLLRANPSQLVAFS